MLQNHPKRIEDNVGFEHRLEHHVHMLNPKTGKDVWDKGDI